MIETWYHLHSGPPYVCHGGSPDQTLVQPLGFALGCKVVQARHRPTVCPYAPPSSRPFEYAAQGVVTFEGKVKPGPVSTAIQDLIDLLTDRRFAILVSTDGFVICGISQSFVDPVTGQLHLATVKLSDGQTLLDALEATVARIREILNR